MSKTLLITGASSGLGAACARNAARFGWTDVVLHYGQNKDGAAQVADDLRNQGVTRHLVQADLSDTGTIDALFAPIRALPPQHFGLINNAGIVGPKASLADLTPKRIKHIFDVNVLSAFEVARQAVLLMRDWQQGGSIVNISSIAARLGSAHEYVDYAASKGAIDTMTKGLANELAGEGIRVNAVRPGIFDTEIHAKGGQPGRAERLSSVIPMGRPGAPDEAAEAILWLLSDKASYSTGTILDTSGGR